MAVRVLFAGAAEPLGGISAETELSRVEARMLSGEDQRRPEAALRKRARDGRQLDRFGPGADDQANVRETQPSP
jgi:hypothetical protein